MKPSCQKAGRYVSPCSDEQDKIFQKIIINNNVYKCKYKEDQGLELAKLVFSFSSKTWVQILIISCFFQIQKITHFHKYS